MEIRWTANGTVLVKDISGLSTTSSNPGNFFNYNGKLLFTATDGRGEELWMSDGTPSGTAIVSDMNSLAGSSSPKNLTLFGDKVVFSATNGATNNGRELWITDGTKGGTKILNDLAPGTADSNPEFITVYNNKVYLRRLPPTKVRSYLQVMARSMAPCC